MLPLQIFFFIEWSITQIDCFSWGFCASKLISTNEFNLQKSLEERKSLSYGWQVINFRFLLTIVGRLEWTYRF